MSLRLAGDQGVVKTHFLSTIFFEAHEVETKSLIPSYAKQKDADFLKGKPEDRKG